MQPGKNLKLFLIAIFIGSLISCEDSMTRVTNGKSSRPSDGTEGLPEYLSEQTIDILPATGGTADLGDAAVTIPPGAVETPVRLKVSRRIVLTDEDDAADLGGGADVSLIEVEIVDAENGSTRPQLRAPVKFSQIIATPGDPTSIKLSYRAPITPIADDPERSGTFSSEDLTIESDDSSLRFLGLQAGKTKVTGEIQEVSFVAAVFASAAFVNDISTDEVAAEKRLLILGKSLHKRLAVKFEGVSKSFTVRSSQTISLAVSGSESGHLTVHEAGEEIGRFEINLGSGGSGTNSSGTNSSGSTSTTSGSGTGGHDFGENETRHRVFVTSQTYTGNLGGMAGAHQKCMMAAKTSLHPTGIYYKTYRAILSNQDYNFGSHNIVGRTGWSVWNTDASAQGAIANSVTEFLAGTGIASTQILTETGSTDRPAQVWTGNQPNLVCNNWSAAAVNQNARVGDPAAYPAASFLNSGNVSCDQTAGIYCIGGMPHFAFITSTGFDGNLGGMSGADAKCQLQADAGVMTRGLGLKWKALLSTDTVNANDTTRMQIQGPIMMLNSSAVAVKVVDDATDLWDASLDRAFEFDENGDAVNVGFWTGTGSAGDNFNFNCSNWTSSQSSIQGTVGSSVFSGGFWANTVNQPCDAQRNLLCVSIQNDL